MTASWNLQKHVSLAQKADVLRVVDGTELNWGNGFLAVNGRLKAGASGTGLRPTHFVSSSLLASTGISLVVRLKVLDGMREEVAAVLKMREEAARIKMGRNSKSPVAYARACRYLEDAQYGTRNSNAVMYQALVSAFKEFHQGKQPLGLTPSNWKEEFLGRARGIAIDLLVDNMEFV